MRKTLRFFASLMAMVLAVGGLKAQTPMPPQLFTYQAVVRDGSNHIVRNRAVGVQISIMQTNPATGTRVYQETQTATTNVNGAFSVVVGSSTTATGSISAIDWSSGPYYLLSQVDIDNDGNYDITTTQQLVSVPYALYCETCANCAGGNGGGGGGAGSYTETQGLSDVVAINNSANNNQLKNLKDPTDPQDAVTKRIIDSITHRYDSILAALTACCANNGGGSTACAASAGTVNIAGTAAICSGATTTLTATATGSRGTLSYQWQKDGVDLPGQTNSTYTASTTGNYTVIVTATDGSCTPTSATANASLNVTVGTAPVLTWNTTPANTTICSGSNTTLTANVTADGGEVVTYTWTPTTGLSASTGASVTAAPTANTTYTVTAQATSATGCPVSETNNVTVTVETPNLTIGAVNVDRGSGATPMSSLTVTAGDEADVSANVLTSSPGGRLGYAWGSPRGDNSWCQTSGRHFVALDPGASSQSMTVYLRVFDTSVNGCTTYKDTSLLVTINPSTPANCDLFSGSSVYIKSSLNYNLRVSTPLSVNVGDEVPLAWYVQGGTGAYESLESLVWTVNQPSSTYSIPSNYSGTKTYVFNTAGTYVVRVDMSYNSGCNVSYEVTVNVAGGSGGGSGSGSSNQCPSDLTLSVGKSGSVVSLNGIENFNTAGWSFNWYASNASGSTHPIATASSWQQAGIFSSGQTTASATVAPLIAGTRWYKCDIAISSGSCMGIYNIFSSTKL